MTESRAQAYGIERPDVGAAPAAQARQGGAGVADRIVGSSDATRRAVEQATDAARGSGPVRILGAPGVGKTHFARAMHGWSARAAGPFVVVSPSAAGPAAAQMRALFGDGRDGGALARAADGTLLVRGADALEAPVLAALVRAIGEGRYRSDGEAAATPLRARVMVSAAEPGPLPEAWSSVALAPLSERSEDIPALAAHFLAEAAAESGLTPVGFSAEARRWLVAEPWVGNVRELRERVRAALELAGGGAISIEALLLSTEGDEIPSFKDAKRAFETRYVESLLRRCGGNISRAARLAKKDRKDFYDVIRRTGVDPQQFRS